MTESSAEDMVDRLRHSMYRLLQWAEAYQPRTLFERERYDTDLDEAEDLLDAVEAWVVIRADRKASLGADSSRRVD